MTTYYLTNETPDDFDTMVKHIKAMIAHGGALEVDVTIKKDHRTHAQNALAWAYNRHLARVYGAEPNYVHDGMKLKLLPLDLVILGEHVRIGNSTAALDKDQFTDYLQRYDADCAANGVLLPAHPMYSKAMGIGE